MNVPTTTPVPHAVPPRSGNTALIVVAVVMGLVCVVITNIYISNVRQEAKGKAITAWRLKVAKNVGDKIRPERDLEAVKLPEEYKDTLTSLMDRDNIRTYANRPLTRRAPQGALVTFELYQKVGDPIDIKIPRGKRAVSLPVNSRNAPGMLRPGMLIDVLATFRPPGGRPELLVVMEGVEVLAVGSSTDEREASRRSFSAITVAVAPMDAEALLAISKYIGRDAFDILVRHPTDRPTGLLGVNPDAAAKAGYKKRSRASSFGGN